jgi:hypothetical protein
MNTALANEPESTVATTYSSELVSGSMVKR